MKTYPTYNSYISRLKYSNECSDSLYAINQKLNYLQEEVDNGCTTEVLYNSPNNTNIEISTKACVTFIESPIDNNTSTTSSTFYLTAFDIKNGTSKQIVNNSSITPTRKNAKDKDAKDKDAKNNIKVTNTTRTDDAVSIISINNYNQGGFSNLGSNYNCYTFSSIGDTLSITWSEINNAWCVISYGGIFSNVVQ